MKAPVALVVVLLALAPATARACIWDHETVLDEERGLPSLMDAILGRYEVHSRAFYEARRDALEPGLKAGTLSADEQDDLAVAYERLGDHARAADLMVAKEARFPGLYTTQANWGTFLVHGGKLEDGVAHLKKAIEINPDAHFGREIYQVRAIEFVLACQKDPRHQATNTMLGPLLESVLGDPKEHRELMPHQLYAKCPWIKEDVWSAIVGMLKLGGDPGEGWHELYFELGELLFWCNLDLTKGAIDQDWRAGKTTADQPLLCDQLAWFALERAKERGSTRLETIARYQTALSERLGNAPDPRASYAALRGAAKAWVAAYQAREAELLGAKKNLEDRAEWASFYATEGHPGTLLVPRILPWWRNPHYYETHLHVFVLLLIPLAIVYYLFDLRRRRRAAANSLRDAKV